MLNTKNKIIILIAVIIVIASAVVFVDTKVQKGTFNFSNFPKQKLFRTNTGPSYSVTMPAAEPLDAVLLPDLVVQSINVRPSPPTDSRVDVTITIKNRGYAGISIYSGDSYIKGYLKTNDASREAPTDAFYIRIRRVLNPGETQTIDVSFGKHAYKDSLDVFVDYNNSVRESNEGNNMDWAWVPTTESDAEHYGSRG